MNVRDLKHDLRTFLSVRAWGLPLFGLRPTNRSLLVGRRTEIVIEGYPRCANTFTVVAFRQAQSRDVRVAHHLHASAQILRAAKWGVPAILLIRDPIEAVVSLMIRHPELSIQRCMRDYLAFYGSLIGIANYPVIADFKDVTENLGSVIRSVNTRFETDFCEFQDGPESVNAVFAEIDAIRRAARRSLAQIATPNSEKDAAKCSVRELVQERVLASDLDSANQLYQNFSRAKDPFI